MNKYQINEDLARRAKQANSFYDCKDGKATSEYNAMVAVARKRAIDAKNRTDVEFHDKIDHVLDGYEKKLADNINKAHEIMARVPSIMIAGAGNFPVAKKQKQNEALDRNFQEFRKIEAMLDKFESIGRGGIRSDSENAKDKIEEKVTEKEKKQEFMKKINAYYKKHGTVKGFDGINDEKAARIDKTVSEEPYGKPYPSFELINNNSEIKRLKSRLVVMQKIEETDYKDFEFDGGNVVFNKDARRIQISFDGKPDDEMRSNLKGKGFRWTPSQKVWQRQLTPNAIYAFDRLNLKPIAEPVVNVEKVVLTETKYKTANTNNVER